MITVIKSGKNKYVCTCPRCGCVFTFSDADLTGRWTSDYNSGRKYCAHLIKCPECSEEIEHYSPCIKNAE